jgi:hypothetical protein
VARPGRQAKKKADSSQLVPGAHLSRLRILEGGLASEDLRGRRAKGVNATSLKRTEPDAALNRHAAVWSL